VSTTIIDTLVALFRIQPDPAGAAAANGMLNGLINRTEQLRQYQDRLAATFAVAGAAVAYSWWEANTQYESLRNSLDLVTGSAEDTARAMHFLEDFATRSPDQLAQLTAAYQMLLAQGLDPTAERCAGRRCHRQHRAPR
jgi:phage tail tape-measure protein